MSTKIWLRPSDGSAQRECKEPFGGADHAVVKGSCPLCHVEPFAVSGKNMRIGGHDEYHADGVCCDCHQRVGLIVAVVSTIFGIEEDERVLNGRPRVY